MNGNVCVKTPEQELEEQPALITKNGIPFSATQLRNVLIMSEPERLQSKTRPQDK